MTELDKLEKYLKEHGYKYERIDVEPQKDEALDRHQIIVYDGEYKDWDAVCHYGSYGHEQGLLEIIGSIVSDDACDAVEGWLTAEDVISRLKQKERERGLENANSNNFFKTQKRFGNSNSIHAQSE